MLVNAAPRLGVFWLWRFAATWDPNPGPPIIPLIIFSPLLVALTGGKLLYNEKPQTSTMDSLALLKVAV